MGEILGISLEDYAMMNPKTGSYKDRFKTGNLGQNQVPNKVHDSLVKHSAKVIQTESLHFRCCGILDLTSIN